MTGDSLKLAAKYLSQGNLAAAEVCCRSVMDNTPQHPVALNMIGIVAALVGLHDSAVAYFARAYVADPAFGSARKNLDKAKGIVNAIASCRPATEHGPKFLLIKAWGCGFWSDVNHVLGALLLAEITDRIPVTHWGKNSCFTDGADQDAFEFYFEPVSDFAIDDLFFLDGPSFFPEKWSKENLWKENLNKWHGTASRLAAFYYLNRSETIAVSDFYIGVVDLMPWIPENHHLYAKSIEELYRYLLTKYLRPQEYILSEVDTFFRLHMVNSRIIAVHLRGSDKQLETGNTTTLNQQYLRILHQTLDPSWRIFLLTDDGRWVDVFRNTYGDRIILMDCQRTSNDIGIHYDKSADHVGLGVEIMKDTYLAIRADKFIGNGQSNVSAMITLLKKWSPKDCVLLAPSVLSSQNLRLYTQDVAENAETQRTNTIEIQNGLWLY